MFFVDINMVLIIFYDNLFFLEFGGYGSSAICSICALVFCCIDLYEECPSLSITISSQIPLGAGLGSSAALSTALSGAILVDSGALNPPVGNIEHHRFNAEEKRKINEISK
jgi:galactokinase